MKTLIPLIALAFCTFSTNSNAGSSVPTCAVDPQPSAIVGNSAPTQVQEAIRTAKRLGTRIDNHLLAIRPEKLVTDLEGGSRHQTLSTSFPIYVLGIEKARNSDVRHVDTKTCDGNGYALAQLREKSAKAYQAACQVMQDANPMLLTHIFRFSDIQSGRLEEPCSIFNLYTETGRCSTSSNSRHDDSLYQYADTMESLRSLRASITTDITERKPSHLLVLSTGWNTQQDESLFNYLDWLQVLSDAAREDGSRFDPLVVALTWESGWDHFFLRGSGVVTKGNDADEIGLTWANALLHDVVLPVGSSSSLPVVLIGHSYGTRVLGTALYRRDILTSPAQLEPRDPVAFIAMQAAFPLKRFTADGAEPLFLTGEQPNTLVVMSASEHDSANGKLKRKGEYAGGGPAIALVRAGKATGTLQYISVDSTGKVKDPAELRRPGIYLADASAMISCAMPGTGGGAHSDVFDREAGRFMWQIMNASRR